MRQLAVTQCSNEPAYWLTEFALCLQWLCGSQQPVWIPITVCFWMDGRWVRGVNSSHRTAVGVHRETRGPWAPHVHAALWKHASRKVCAPHLLMKYCICHSHAYIFEDISSFFPTIWTLYNKNSTMRCHTEEYVFCSSLCHWRGLFLVTVASDLLIRHLDLHPDFCNAALWQWHLLVKSTA